MEVKVRDTTQNTKTLRLLLLTSNHGTYILDETISHSITHITWEHVTDCVYHSEDIYQ